MPDSPIATLAARQLDAYNAGDLDAFLECYHPHVVVWEGGEITVEGRDAMRDRYAPMFDQGGFGATVPERVCAGRHCVDLEHWWRDDPDTQERHSGALLVRYTLLDEFIGEVQFLD